MNASPISLEVRLNGFPVGVLSRLPGNTVAFSFAEQYVQDPMRPTLSWGFYDAYHRLRSKALSSSLGAIPPFFTNLLPESDLRRYVAQRAGISKDDDFALLWVTGDDLPGAVTVHDPANRPQPPAAAGGPDSQTPPNVLLRFSLAGVQLKFSAIENAAGGLTLPMQGLGGRWIVKLPSRHFNDVPENEYAMLNFARRVGIEVPEVELIGVERIEGLPEEATGLQGAALKVRRFDRGEGEQRIHIEDFNQIYRQPPGRKYDDRSFADIAKTVYEALGNDGLVDFIHRLVFNLGIGNNDMHLKNWSFIYRDGRTPALAPAYDYVCTKVYLRSNETGLPIGSARYFPAVTSEQFDNLARRAGVSRGVVRQATSEMIDRMRVAWPNVRSAVPFDAMRATIDEQFERLPLFSPAAPHFPVPALRQDGHHEVS